MTDILLDAVLDTLKLIPFLLITYLAMEYVEHKTTMKVLVALKKADKVGPLLGGVLGAVPQCGFSAAASGLYAGKIITLGTLISIYLSTSDEMLPILISEKAPVSIILKLVLLKIVIGVISGFLCDFVFFRSQNAHEHINIHGMCEKEHCNCEKGIFGSALKHTASTTAFIFLITVILNVVIEYVGEDAISGLVFNTKVLGPILSGIVGLIPNCAASVVITKLYLEGAMGLGALMAGLLSSAGVGWLVFARISRSGKKTLQIIALLYAFSVVSGLILSFLNL